MIQAVSHIQPPGYHTVAPLVRVERTNLTASILVIKCITVNLLDYSYREARTYSEPLLPE